mmetsp:Transcript_26528/g.30346  ORF Transcript_26528/g.30346 Transcript_26528/m.30346 type:complete len:499 (-) Transcript_26528:206-1702(-)
MTEPAIPSNIYPILTSFFQKAIERFEDCPNLVTIDISDPNHEDKGDNDNEYIPITLNDHRKKILQEQINVLEQCVSEYNENNHDTLSSSAALSSYLTIEQMQSYLRILGSSTTNNNHDNENNNNTSKTTQTKQENEFNEVLNLMSQMNEVARITFVKCILSSEFNWSKKHLLNQFPLGQADNCSGGSGSVNSNIQHKSNLILDYTKVNRPNLHHQAEEEEEQGMDRNSILEFCGLCATAVTISQVQEYIKHGEEISFETKTNHDDGNGNDSEVQDDEKKFKTFLKTNTTPHERIVHLQHLMLCAVGYEPNYGGVSMRNKMIMNEHTNDKDEELDSAFAAYLLSMQSIAKEAIVVNASRGLSDQNEGGVTRVVSVNYSEREVPATSCPHMNDGSSSNNVEPPTNQFMEQQNEEKQRRQLYMAQQAVQIQKKILDDLLEMDSNDREICLKEAQNAHEQFISDAMALPSSERVEFMSNVDPGLQKMLLMYKVWEGHQRACQ